MITSSCGFNVSRFVPLSASLSSATPGTIITVAGSTLGTAGYTGDGGAATSATLHQPTALAIDNAGNIFVAEWFNNSVRMIPAATANCFGVNMTAGSIYTVAGNGAAAYTGDSGPATSATINNPYAIAVDGNGDLFIADTGNNAIRFVPATTGTYFGLPRTRANIYTIAGSGGAANFSGDGAAATSAKLANPYGLAVDGLGNLIVSDTNNFRVRMVPAITNSYYGTGPITAENIDTIAGTGVAGNSGDTAAATSAQVTFRNIAVSLTRDLYFADSNHNVIRMIPATTASHFGVSMTAGDIYTIAGGGGLSADGETPLNTLFTFVTDIAVDSSGNVFIDDYGTSKIRMIAAATGTFYGVDMVAGNVYTIAGNGTGGYTGDNGPAFQAELNTPYSIALDTNGNLYIADTSNNVIRKVFK